MTLFWIAALVLVVLSIALLLPALRKKPVTGAALSAAEQAELNKAIYRERLQELETELANGELDQSNFDAMVVELQSSLLDDVDDKGVSPAEQPAAGGERPLLAIVFAVIVLLAVPAIGYWQLGAHQQVEHWQEVQYRLQEYMQRGVMQQGEPLTEADLRDFALALRTELQQKPTDDPSVWLLLGRIGMAINDGELAMGAMEHAYRQAPTNPSVALGYAQIAMYSQDPQVVHRGKRVLDGLLAHDPDNLDALSLKAFQAFENGEHAIALTTWRKMAGLLPVDDPRKATIERTMRMVEMQLAQAGAQADATPQAQPAAAGTTAPADAGQQISVVVNMDPALRGDIPANADLIVFARAKDGPPMPLAVKRMPVGKFPVQVMLSDSDAMMPSMKLSSFPQVYVTARISQDQDVKISAGELEGIGDTLSLNGEPLATSVTINVKH